MKGTLCSYQTITDTPRRPSVSRRAIGLGLLITVFVNLGSPYTESVGFSNFSWSYLPEGAAIPFLILLFLNLLVRRCAPRQALSRGELLSIFILALVANATPVFLMYFQLAAIVSPYYFASPENRWKSDLIPYMRPWLIVSDRRHAVEWFYEGLPPDESIPWGAWLLPLTFWIPFLATILGVSYLLTVLFRRQWIDHEKLAYPLMQVPLQMVREADPGERPLLRHSLFWWGVMGPLGIAILAVWHAFVPAVPALPVDHLGGVNWGAVQLPPPFPNLTLCLSFLAVGVGYFVPTEVLFSIWFLYLLVHILEEGIFTQLGLSIGYGGMFVWGNAAIAWQSFGAFMIMLATVLWSARAHLIRYARYALQGAPPEFAGEELLSPRQAALLLLGGLALIGGWLSHSGMPLEVIGLFVPMLFLIYLGLARVVCQAGIFYVVPPVIAQNSVICILGSERIGRQGMISLGLSYAWHGDVQTVMSALSAEGVRLQRPAQASDRKLSGAMLGTALVGLGVASWGIIYTGYRQGAITWPTWVFRGWGPNTYEQVLAQLRDPFGFGTAQFAWCSVGAVLMVLLTALQRRFLWWPLHPLGLVVVSSFTMYAVYAGFFLAWLAKVALLRWGGFQAYRRAIPFFLGLTVGHYLGRAVALTVMTWTRTPWII